ncbi:MAG: hypothetical protein N2258_04970 [Brevinematales bacterium]|nr:hypothetical protein [Brevinematales bacterium]
MGLRKKAQKYLELLIADRLDRLEEIYEGQNLSKDELIEIKSLISKKIFQTEREYDKKIELLENILSLQKKFENLKKEEMLELFFKELKENFCVKKALFFENVLEKSFVRKVISLPEDLLNTEIEWSVQENKSIEKGEADIFDNSVHFHKILPEIESYLLVPIKIKETIYGGLIIFLIEDMKCFSSKENTEVFSWIAHQFAYPYFILD